MTIETARLKVKAVKPEGVGKNNVPCQIGTFIGSYLTWYIVNVSMINLLKFDITSLL